MREKDITEKKLEDFVDVFADIINVLIFDGERRVDGKHLHTALPRSIYKAGGRISEQERDTAKYWRDGSTWYALFGLENQTKKEVREKPLRIISYDGAEYRAQIRKRDDVARQNARQQDKNNRKPLPEYYPVVTIVLYFGLEPWEEPVNLKSCFNIPEGLDDYVNDYKVNLYQVAFLDDDTVEKFQSDFKIVAQYFVQSRKKKDGIIDKCDLSAYQIVHSKEVLELMSTLTEDQTFEKAYSDVLKGGNEQMDTLINFIQQEAAEAKETIAKRDETILIMKEEMAKKDEKMAKMKEEKDEELAQKDEEMAKLKEEKDEELAQKDEEMAKLKEELNAEKRRRESLEEKLRQHNMI